MRFMCIVTSSEALAPSPKLLEAMHKLRERESPSPIVRHRRIGQTTSNLAVGPTRCNPTKENRKCDVYFIFP